jgi:FOG: WD40 repeat
MLILKNYIQKQNQTQNTSIQAIDFSYDGSLVAVGTGKYIFLYTTIDGKLHHRLKGHRDQIYTLSYSHDGELLASGGMDKCTIIWTKEGTGILKFTHDSSIQVVAFNPLQQLLVSCSSHDIGFWSPRNQGVKKNKIDSKVLSAAWKQTGDILAIGLLSGDIHFVSASGNFQHDLTMGSPVWALHWCSVAKHDYKKDGELYLLVIGTWDSVVTYYDPEKNHILSKIDVGGFPMTLTSLDAPSSCCEFVIVGTTNGNMKIINDKRVIVGEITLGHDGWPWCTKIYSSDNSQDTNLAYVGKNGQMSLLKVYVDCLTAVCDDFIAFSQNGTSVNILNYESVKVSALNINSHIIGIDMTSDILAVICNGRISIYSLAKDKAFKRLNFVIQSDISITGSTALCKIVGDDDIIVVSFTQISMHNISSGRKLSTWEVPCAVTSISNHNSSSGIGDILLGCEDGSIFSLSLSSTPSVVKILKVEQEPKILARGKQQLIGIIDKATQLIIYGKEDQCMKNWGEQATAIVFHNELESLYCYHSIEGSLKVKDGDAQTSIIVNNKFHGQILKFTGCVVYIIDHGTISSLKVNLSPFVEEKMQIKQFDTALSIAKLGITESKIWDTLAHISLMHLHLDIFKECYLHLRKDDSEMSTMMERLETNFKHFDEGVITEDQLKCMVRAELDVIDGYIERAGETFLSIGYKDRAIELFLAYNMIHKAKLVPKQTVVQRNSISMSEARWEEESNKNYFRASELYAECGCYLKSVQAANKIEGDKRFDTISSISKLIPISEIDVLTQCCHYLEEDARYFNDLRDILLKIKNFTMLITIYMRKQLWAHVAAVWEEHRSEILDKQVIYPYADWLAGNGNIKDALKVNREAGQCNRNKTLLSFLIKDAIAQESYYEVSKLLWEVAIEARKDNENSVSLFNGYSSATISILKCTILKTISLFSYCTSTMMR